MLFHHFVCKYPLNAISMQSLQLRERKASKFNYRLKYEAEGNEEKHNKARQANTQRLDRRSGKVGGGQAGEGRRNIWHPKQNR